MATKNFNQMATVAFPSPPRTPGKRLVSHPAQRLALVAAVLLFYTFWIPPEVAIYLGTFRLGMHRIALLAMTPLVAYLALTGAFRLRLVDVLVLFSALWIPVSFYQNYDASVATEAGGALILEMLIPYFIGRSAIRSVEDMRGLLKMLLPGLLIIGAALFFESVGGDLYVRKTAQRAFGQVIDVDSAFSVDYRLGLVRAYSVFTHPIHAGIFMSSFLLLYFFNFKDIYHRYVGAFVAFLGFFSLSSAAILGLALLSVMAIFDWLQQRFRELSWALLFMSASLLVILIQVFSKSGFVSVFYRYLTLNSGTGNYRELIWQYATLDALRHPWFGIGYEEYARPAWMYASTIDAHYLAMSVSYGLIASLGYLAVAILILSGLIKRVSTAKTTALRQIYLSLAITLAVVIFQLFTVTLWGAMLSWFNIFLGLCVSISYARTKH